LQLCSFAIPLVESDALLLQARVEVVLAEALAGQTPREGTVLRVVVVAAAAARETTTRTLQATIELHYSEWDAIPRVFLGLQLMKGSDFVFQIHCGPLAQTFTNSLCRQHVTQAKFKVWSWTLTEHRVAAFVYLSLAQLALRRPVGSPEATAQHPANVAELFRSLGSPRAWLQCDNWLTRVGQTLCASLCAGLGAAPERPLVRHAGRFNELAHRFGVLHHGSWAYPRGDTVSVNKIP
jgi:hypothetical protein